MDMILKAATGVCFSAVIIGSVYIISPAYAAGKGMKFILGLLMLISIISPFTGIDFPKPEDYKESEISLDTEQMLRHQTVYVIETTLKNEGFNFEKTEIHTDISKDGHISINSIYIYGAADGERMREFIKSTFMVQEVVIYD